MEWRERKEFQEKFFTRRERHSCHHPRYFIGRRKRRLLTRVSKEEKERRGNGNRVEEDVNALLPFGCLRIPLTVECAFLIDSKDSSFLEKNKCMKKRQRIRRVRREFEGSQKRDRDGK